MTSGVSREVLSGLEGPIAVAQQHRDGVGSDVDHHEIRLGIAVEVAYGDGAVPAGAADGKISSDVNKRYCLAQRWSRRRRREKRCRGDEHREGR